MKNLFLPFKEALALKRLGFDRSCFGWGMLPDKNFIISPCFRYRNKIRFKTMLQRPTYQQAFDWFRDEHGLFSWIETDIIPFTNGQLIHSIKINKELLGSFETYPKARVALVKALIDRVRNPRLF